MTTMTQRSRVSTRTVTPKVDKPKADEEVARGPENVFALAVLIIIVFGGLFAYGGAAEVSTAKLIYAVVLIGLGGLVGIWALIRPAKALRSGAARFWMIFGILTILLITINTLIAPEFSPIAAVRQGLFYVLIPIAPVIGLQLGSRLTERETAVIALVVGLASAVGFAVDWLTRRGVSALGIDRLWYGSLSLAALGFCVAILLIFHGHGAMRIWGWVTAVVVPIALLITGTRTNLVTLLLPIVMFGAARRKRIPATGAVVLSLLYIVATALMLAIAPTVIANDDFLQLRVNSLFDIFTGGLNADGSFAARAEQSLIAQDIIADRPYTGMGLAWSPNISLDTPLAVVARLGIPASILLVLGLIGWNFAAGRAIGRGRSSVFLVARWAFLLYFFVMIPFGTSLGDRGYALALLLLFAGVGAHAAADKDMAAPEALEGAAKVGGATRAQRLTKVSAPRA